MAEKTVLTRVSCQIVNALEREYTIPCRSMSAPFFYFLFILQEGEMELIKRKVVTT